MAVTKALVLYDGTVTGDVTGDTFEMPRSGFSEELLSLEISGFAGTTTPNVTATVEASWDGGTTWVEVDDCGGARTADGSYLSWRLNVAAPTTELINVAWSGQIPYVGPLVRVDITTTTLTTATLTVKLWTKDREQSR